MFRFRSNRNLLAPTMLIRAGNLESSIYTQQHINLPLYVPLPSFNFALLLKSMWLGSTEHAAEHSFHFCHQIAPLFNNKFLLTFLAGAGTPGAKCKIRSIYDA